MKKIADIFITALLTVIFTLTLPLIGEVAYNSVSGVPGFSSKSQSKNIRYMPRIQKKLIRKHLWGFSGVVWGADFTDLQAIRCIIGEAEDQGYIGMVAIGEAIRNRGHLKGVYGCTSVRLLSVGDWLVDQASEAWRDSETSNLVKGADHWHSDREKPVWWEKYGTLTAKIGNHKFYKEVKR